MTLTKKHQVIISVLSLMFGALFIAAILIADGIGTASADDEVKPTPAPTATPQK